MQLRAICKALDVIALAANPYRTLDDAQLAREVQALELRVVVFKASSTPSGMRLLHEFRKRLDDARAEQERRGRI